MCAVAATLATGCPRIVFVFPSNSFSIPRAIAVAFSLLTVPSSQPQSSAALLALVARALASNGFCSVPILIVLESTDSKSRFPKPIFTATASVVASLLDVVFELLRFPVREHVPHVICPLLAP